MKIGLLIAIEAELKAFLESGAELKTEKVNGRTVYLSRIAGHEIFALCSGCGEIDAAAGTQLLITKYGCEAIVNFGVTGALIPALRTEDLFVVRKVCHYGFDTSAIDPVKEHQYMEFPDEFIPLDPGLIKLVAERIPGIRKITVASGDKFVEDRTEKLRLRAAGCGICEMELAGIARVCERSGVKCLSIKCISDAFDGTGADFEKNVRASAEKAFAAIREVLKVLE